MSFGVPDRPIDIATVGTFQSGLMGQEPKHGLTMGFTTMGLPWGISVFFSIAKKRHAPLAVALLLSKNSHGRLVSSLTKKNRDGLMMGY